MQAVVRSTRAGMARTGAQCRPDGERCGLMAIKHAGAIVIVRLGRYPAAPLRDPGEGLPP